MAVIASKVVQVPKYATVPVGTTWLFEENGTFTVPADGKYQIEIHGGGGGAAYASPCSAGGGGSGELIELALTEGDAWDITIGAGGTRKQGNGTGGTGGTSYFGSFAQPGGAGGYVYNAYSTVRNGEASGSIASKGGATASGTNAGGGQGNINNTAQTYGDGGSVVNSTAQNGQPGAVIITYLGVS